MRRDGGCHLVLRDQLMRTRGGSINQVQLCATRIQERAKYAARSAARTD